LALPPWAPVRDWDKKAEVTRSPFRALSFFLGASGLMKRCVLLAALLVVAGASAQANPVGLSANQLWRLEHGEIVVLDVVPPGGGIWQQGQGGTAVTFVNASPKTVWRVLVGYPRHRGLYPRLTRAQMLAGDRGRTLVRYVVGVGPLSFGFHVDHYPDEAPGPPVC